MKKETCRCQGDTQSTDEHAAKPESLSLGQKRDRADDQPYFQKRLSSIKSVGLPNRQIALVFQILRLFADIDLVALVVLHFLGILLFQFFAQILVQRRHELDDVGESLSFVEAHALRLVLCPGAGGLCFKAQPFGMRPVTEQGHTGHKYRHYRDRNRDGEDQRMILVPVMTLRKLDALAHCSTRLFKD